jgi:hypothetical protein
MRPWLHIAAAFVGFIVAAIIVVVVFSRADEEASRQTGGAVGSAVTASGGGEVSASCARIGPAMTGSPAAIRASAASPPTLYDGSGREVSQPRVQAQRDWITRVNAALGDCTEELAIAPGSIRASATYPAGLASAQLNGYAYAFLTQAFRPPLVRPLVTLEVARGAHTQRLVVRASAWNAFQHGRAAYGMQSNIAGMRAFKAKTGLTSGELSFVNWR